MAKATLGQKIHQATVRFRDCSFCLCFFNTIMATLIIVFNMPKFEKMKHTHTPALGLNGHIIWSSVLVTSRLIFLKYETLSSKTCGWIR